MNMCLSLLLSIGVLGISQSALAENICSPSMAKGTTCSCKVSALHPTQISVGMLYVNELTEKGLAALTKHAEKKPTQIAFGPNAVMYVLDGHHHAAAMSSLAPSSSSNCQIAGSVTQLSGSLASFWTQMANHGFARLQGPDGVTRNGVFPPASLNAMANDPFRSVAAWVEQACHIKLKGDYAEFDLADLLRHDLKAVTPHIERDKTASVDEAIAFIHDPNNQAALGKISGAKFSDVQCDVAASATSE